MKNELKKIIREGSMAHGSMPFWSWNDKLDPIELRRQINIMHDLGMNGFFMHARGGLETEYLSNEWFDCINQCIDEAKKLGMEAWSYDENGWPSGFAGGLLLKDPANHALYLTCDNIENGSNEYVYSINGEKVVVHIKSDSSYVDTMDANIVRKFIEATHENYKHRIAPADFGKAMPGFFTDEPQYYRWATPWSNKIPHEFMKRYGYSVFDGLPSLFMDYEGADSFRYDYHKLCHELFINNFIRQIYDWCNDNNCKITGHAVEESVLSGQMWCCGGVMPFYEYEHIPGIDYLGRGLSSDLASKQIGSACSQLGKKEVLSEMFACCGWDVTPLDLKRIAELQYSGGVNMMCQHLYPYSIRGQRKRDYPAHYSEHLPWQSVLKSFNNYFNNLGCTLSLGSESVNALVIHPIHSAYMKYKRPQDGASIAELEKQTLKLSNLLSENQIPYHYGDENMMINLASVEDKIFTVGLCDYKFVIIPYSYNLDSNTANLLRQFLSNGGKLWIYSEVPTCIDGRIADLSWLHSNVTFDEIKAAAESKISLENNNIPMFRQQVRNTENGRIIFITNLDDKIYEDVKVNIKGCESVAELDMNTLVYKPVRCVKSPDNSLDITLDFDRIQSYVLVENAVSEAVYTNKECLPIKLKNNFRFSKLPENAYTLDYAQISYDGVNFEQIRPIVHVKDLLLRNKYKGKLYLKYIFKANEIPETLNIAAEPLKYNDFKINGHKIEFNDGWWLDRSFKTADIKDFIKVGSNDIVYCIDYYQQDYVYYVLYGGVSETLRNCLNFDVEIESLYLFGKFALKTNSECFVPSERHSICYNGNFAIEKQKNKIDVTDIVTDGYPFFGGIIDVETDYTYSNGMPAELYLNGRFAAADILVNGNHICQLMFTDHCDLSKYLKEGNNVIGLKLYNSNRNLLGPHHRSDPEPYGVGPNTFSFENEWDANGKCAAYTDRYAFIRFGIDL